MNYRLIFTLTALLGYWACLLCAPAPTLLVTLLLAGATFLTAQPDSLGERLEREYRR